VTGPASPAGRPPPLAHAEPAMGTVFSFAVVTGALPQAAVRAAVAGACAVLHRCDALFSTWDETSPVSRFRRGEATLSQMPPEFHEVLGECRAARQVSDGWFDPWAMPGGFDPTGLVKGWATERALGVLRDAGVPGALINGGGDVAAFGSPAGGQRWRVGIRHPWRPGALAGVVAATGAVATSGSYERGPHLIDPRTGQPASRVASATVTGPRLALADALATGVAVGGDEALPAVSRLAGYGAYLIRSDGSETSIGGIEFAR
jgi:thiamine biosynthesis lipoprotein